MQDCTKLYDHDPQRMIQSLPLKRQNSFSCRMDQDTSPDLALKDCARIIFGIIRHYEHTFHRVSEKKALLAKFALSASFAAQNCHLLIMQPICLARDHCYRQI